MFLHTWSIAAQTLQKNKGVFPQRWYSVSQNGCKWSLKILDSAERTLASGPKPVFHYWSPLLNLNTSCDNGLSQFRWTQLLAPYCILTYLISLCIYSVNFLAFLNQCVTQFFAGALHGIGPATRANWTEFNKWLDSDQYSYFAIVIQKALPFIESGL